MRSIIRVGDVLTVNSRKCCVVKIDSDVPGDAMYELQDARTGVQFRISGYNLRVLLPH